MNPVLMDAAGVCGQLRPQGRGLFGMGRESYFSPLPLRLSPQAADVAICVESPQAADVPHLVESPHAAELPHTHPSPHAAEVPAIMG